MQALVCFFQNEIVIQAIGFLGMVAGLLALQCKSYKRLNILRVLGELFFGIQFMLLGAWSGMATNYAAVFINSIYRHRIKKEKSTLPFQIAFSFFYTGLCILTWEGWVSLLVIGAKVLSTIAMGINNTATIRIINLIFNPMWMVYDIAVGAYSSFASDALGFVLLLFALLRLDIIPALRAKRAATKQQDGELL